MTRNHDERLMSRQDVQRLVGDKCQYGVQSKDKEGIGPARKRTGFLINVVCIAKRLNKRCPNTRTHQVHRQVVLISGRPRTAQIYPDKMCKEICLDIQEHIQRDRSGQYLSGNVENNNETTSGDLMKEVGKLKEKYMIIEEDEIDQDEEAWDDVSGAQLDPQEVRRARKEEIEYVH